MTDNPRPNPYVGTRPFQQGERLYGRGRERRRLLDQLIADRIVLLNSPSGAGKTSLIQAALIPDLREEQFLVLPVARVNSEPPAELAGRGVNRYLLSLLSGLDEESGADDGQAQVGKLTGLTLDGYLAQVEAANPGRNLVLIVDQFEEIVTLDPTDDAGRQAFFDELGVALRNRRRWALFAMREEFVARLDPFVRPVPGRLAARFRLELLSPQGALEAIQGPPAEQGVAFDPAAAARLVDDLRAVRVQGSDGNTLEMAGNAVEPVQLQVVCQRLWNGLDADDLTIGRDDVEALGDVSRALEAYFDEQVAATAAGQPDLERAIRDWFETQLITAQDIRSQIAREPGATRGLDNAIIQQLDDRRLVRTERRRGVDWFELAHDRLIQPIKASNAAWRKAHLAGWQQRAILWDQQGRPADLLLTGSNLAEAQQAAEPRQALPPLDKAFLDASGERQRQRRQRAWLVVAGVLLATALLVAGGLVLRLRSQARAEALRSESARLVALSESVQHSDPDVAGLLAVEAGQVWRDPGQPDPLLALLAGNPRLDRVLRLAAYQPKTVLVDGHFAIPAPPIVRGNAVRAVAVNPASGALAVADDQAVYLIDRATGELLTDAPLAGGATDLAFSPDGAWLAAAGQDGQVSLWNLSASPPERRSFQAAPGAINGLAFDPAGERLLAAGKNSVTAFPLAAAGDPAGETLLAGANTLSLAVSPKGIVAVGHDDGTVSLLDANSRTPTILHGPAGRVRSVAFSPDGAAVAAAIQTDARDLGQSAVLVWPAVGGDPTWRAVNKTGTVNSVAFVRDGQALATGSRDNQLTLWELAAGLPETPAPTGHRSQVMDLAYDQTSQTLVSGDGEGRVFLWRFDTPSRLATPLSGHTDQVYSVAYSPDGEWLASGDREGALRLWKLASGEARLLSAGDSALRAVEFTPDGAHLAVARQNAIEVWQLRPEPKLAARLDSATAEGFSDIAVSPDGQTLAGADASGAVTLWKLPDLSAPRLLTTLPPDQAAGLTLAFAADGKTLYTGDAMGLISGWDVTSGGERPGFLGDPTTPVLDLAVSPDGRVLAAASGNSAIYLWRLADGQPLGSGLLAGHSLPAASIAFDPSSTRLASAGLDGRLILWNVAGQQAIGVFNGHTGPVNAATFSPDGAQVATAGDDHQVLLWAASPEQWEQLACRTAGRPLTDEEATRYLAGRAPAACLEVAAPP